MRPNKQINPGAHRSGPEQSTKGRYFTTESPDTAAADPAPNEAAVESGPRPEGAPVLNKYAARASVAPDVDRDYAEVVEGLDHEEWTDPLDDDEIDLSSVTIDLRETLRSDVPETYYQRLISKIPGRD